MGRKYITELVKRISGQKRTLGIPLYLIDLCDGDHIAAIVLNQILFEADDLENPDAWMPISYPEWRQLTRLSKYQVNRAVGVLKDVGLQTKICASENHGYSPTVHYRVEGETLEKALRQLFGVFDFRTDGEETSLSKRQVSSPLDSEVSSRSSLKKKKTLDKNKEKESPDSPNGDSHSGDNLIAKGDALLEALSLSVKAEDSGSQPTDSQSEDAKLQLPAPSAPKTKPVPVPKPLIEAVGYAFNEPPGPYAGKIGQFFLGKLKKKGDGWFEWQPEPSPTPELIPQQIVAFTLWYSRHEKYAESFVKQGNIMPMTPSLLRDHWDRYIAREEKVHTYWMEQAKPILERLLKGEKIRPETAKAQSTDGRAAGPVESVQAYKPYNPKAESAYAVRTDPDDTLPEPLGEPYEQA